MKAGLEHIFGSLDYFRAMFYSFQYHNPQRKNQDIHNRGIASLSNKLNLPKRNNYEKGKKGIKIRID